MATKQEEALTLAQNIATAVFTKLKLTTEYRISVRRHAEPAAMPWIEIAFGKLNKPAETHEHCVSLPEFHYICETQEQRSDTATYIYKVIAMMTGKLEPK